MLCLFLCFSASWKDKMMAVAGEIGLEQLGYALHKDLNDIFMNAGDIFKRVSQSAAWLYYAERPPFNIHSFDHWHFKSMPINTLGRPVIQHINKDNLDDNLYTIRQKVLSKAITRTWPFAFALKLYLCFQCDIFAPLHLSEYYSEEFPNGDRNGRDFYVVMNGKKLSLYDAWESGCGYAGNDIDFEKEEDWLNIDKMKEAIGLEFHEFEYISNSNIIKETFNYTRDVVYKGLKNNSVLSEDYISECQAHTKEQIFRAGKTIASDLEEINLISIAKQLPAVSTIRTSEVVAWSLLLIFTPFAALLVWKKHFSTK